MKSDQFGFSAAENIYEDEKDKKYFLVNLLYLYKEKGKGEREKIINRITEYVKNTNDRRFLFMAGAVRRKTRMYL